MKHNHHYNVNVLLDAARDYCDCERDYMDHSLRLSAAKKSGEYWDCAEGWKRDNNYYYNAARSAREKFNDMCALVSADPSTVLSVYKSIRRYTQYQCAWEREPHMYHSWEFFGEDYEPGTYESFCRFCAES